MTFDLRDGDALSMRENLDKIALGIEAHSDEAPPGFPAQPEPPEAKINGVIDTDGVEHAVDPQTGDALPAVRQAPGG